MSNKLVCVSIYKQFLCDDDVSKNIFCIFPRQLLDKLNTNIMQGFFDTVEIVDNSASVYVFMLGEEPDCVDNFIQNVKIWKLDNFKEVNNIFEFHRLLNEDLTYKLLNYLLKNHKDIITKDIINSYKNIVDTIYKDHFLKNDFNKLLEE